MPRIDSVDGGRVPRVWISAAGNSGMELLRETIARVLQQDRVRCRLRLPDSAGRLRARLFASGFVASEHAVDSGWELDIDAPRSLLEPLFGLPGGDGDRLRRELAGAGDSLRPEGESVAVSG